MNVSQVTPQPPDPSRRPLTQSFPRPLPRLLPRRARESAKVAVWVLVLTGIAVAQDGGSGGDLRRAYDDVVNQLKSAQDRKNELANENEKLLRRLAELERRAKGLEARNTELERAATDYAASTYHYRSTQAAWKQFLDARPDVRQQWDRYLKDAGGWDSTFGGLGDWLERSWPLRQG